jgi:hypothetical protein
MRTVYDCFARAADFQHAQAESSTTRHHWAVKKKSASRKVLIEVMSVLVHQALLLIVDIVRKCRPRWDELEEKVLFGHCQKL